MRRGYCGCLERNGTAVNRWGTEIKAAMISQQTGQEEKLRGNRWERDKKQEDK